MRNQFLRPDGDKLRSGREKLLLGMHAPCDADGAYAAFASVLDVADRVCDENDLMAGLKSDGLLAFAIGGRAIAINHVRLDPKESA